MERMIERLTNLVREISKITPLGIAALALTALILALNR